MGYRIPICLADFLAIKALALLALAVVAYLYWTSFKEKRLRRREREWLEARRRELKEKTAGKS
jgi:cbb3-type cytochrome oxidase subunit 3